jgi:hypothetical protein
MDQQPKIAALPEDFWAEEDAQRQSLEQIVAENGLGGYNEALPEDAYAEDEVAEESPVQTDETGPTGDNEAESAETPPGEIGDQPVEISDIDEAVNELTKRKPM